MMKKSFLFFLFFALSPLLAIGVGSHSSCGSKSSPCLSRFKLGGEWLYWKAEQSQMETAANVGSSNGGIAIHSSPIIPNFKFSSGYRLYADYVANNCWGVGIAFAHLPSYSSVSVFNDPTLLTTNFIPFNDNLFPMFTIFSQSGMFLSNYNVRWKLDLYYLDLYIKRTFCPCRCIALVPYIGGRGFWMKQDMYMKGNAPNAAGGALALAAAFGEKFGGGGLLAGMRALWEWKYGFSLVAAFGGSLTYSYAKVNFNIDAEQAGAPLQLVIKHIYHKSHPTVDSFIGLKYCHAFCSCAVEAHIGWENHLFFHVNQFSLTTNGNLSAQGLILGGSFLF